MDESLYPMKLYVYDHNGYHDEGVQINSEAQLNGPGVTLILKSAIESGVEVRITDPGDFLLFHAKDKKIYFDGATQYPEGRPV